jgi:hypothetical protein
MSRNLSLIVLSLLLAISVAVTDEVPESERAADTGEPSVQKKQGDDVAPESEDKAGVERTRPQTEDDAKLISGMSVLGNQEAPKSLVIVPWKSSEIGDSVGFSTVLDDSREPVDKEVFMRALSYYEIRTQKTP